MDSEMKDKLREASRRRGRCPKCAGPLTHVQGDKLDAEGHFAEVVYAVCNGCGFERPTKARKGKR